MFDKYFVLGDSMSIDFYPAEDAKHKQLSENEKIGSASLLFENDSVLFPEFKGKDLSTYFPGISFNNLAVDGATCDELIDNKQKLAFKELISKNCLISLTVGGNDLLSGFRKAGPRDKEALASEGENIARRYEAVVSTIREILPECTLLLTTIYDPTDGTGILPTISPLYQAKLPVENLNAFNDHIRLVAQKHDALFADVRAHFRGHGAEAAAADQFWFWKPSPIEPSYTGASEIRRVWLETLAAAKLI